MIGPRGLLLTLAIFAAPVTAAADGLEDCARYALEFNKRQGGNITRIKIERGGSLTENRFDDMVGSQRVSTEYMGFAQITTGTETKRLRFVCLHPGGGKEPVYFGLIYD